MAKKKQPKTPFFTEGMSVDQILSLGYEQLNKMSRRDLSRALRTVSLAANKRLNRLQAKATTVTNEMGDTVYVDKTGKGYTFDALYFTGGKKFGVGKTKDRNAIYKEFARVRGFMGAKSSTLSGAIELRKQREKAMFGMTREQMPAAQRSEVGDLMKDVYAEYHKWKEEYEMTGGYSKEKGRRVLKMFGRRVNKGMTPEEARQSIYKYYDMSYEEETEQQLETNPDTWPLLADEQNKNDWMS